MAIINGETPVKRKRSWYTLDEERQAHPPKGQLPPVRIEVVANRQGRELVVGFTPYNEDDSPVRCSGEAVVSILVKQNEFVASQLGDTSITVTPSKYKRYRVGYWGDVRLMYVVRLFPDQMDVGMGSASLLMASMQESGYSFAVRVSFTPKVGQTITGEDDFLW